MRRDAATYALLLRLEHDTALEIGRLGLCRLPRGYYLYVGSALSGLAPRLRRHLRRAKAPRWHIDWLTALCPPQEVWYVLSRERWECHWSQAARSLPGASIPAPGFGASDCHCTAHLVHFASAPPWTLFREALGEAGAGLRRTRQPARLASGLYAVG